MWSGIYTLLIILVGIIIVLVMIISGLHDELREAKKKLQKCDDTVSMYRKEAIRALVATGIAMDKVRQYHEEYAQGLPTSAMRFAIHDPLHPVGDYIERVQAILQAIAFYDIHF